MKKRVILDVDTGSDDAIALLMAGHAPSLELVGVTVVYGNASLEVTSKNTLKVLDAAGLGYVPVMGGMARPLTQELPRTNPQQSRELPLPEPRMQPSPQHAVDFLISHFELSRRDTTLVPLAPLTNIAMALLLEPSLADKIPQVVLMGGAWGEGNVTPSAEFNIYADPEAARIVFQSGIPITMVGLDVTHKALVTMDDVERVRTVGTTQAKITADLMAADMGWFREILGLEGVEVFDACAVASVVDPDILVTQPMWVDIETAGELTLGRTVCDISGQTGRKPNVEVGVDIDRQRFLETMLQCLK